VHSTSPNPYNYRDELRFSPAELTAFLSSHFEVVKCYEQSNIHPDVVYIGRKKSCRPITVFKPVVDVEKLLARLRTVFTSGWWGPGPLVEEFEAAAASYLGVPHFVLLSSCTAALDLSIKYLRLKKGIIASTPITFVSTNHAILYNGCTPLFVDVEPRTGNMDVASLADALDTYDVAAIVVVHLGGYSCDMQLINELAAARNISVIEDAAHAFGAQYDGRRCGQNTTCYSFHAVKNLPMGDGGGIATHDPDLASWARRMRWMGIDRDTASRSVGGYSWEYEVDELGYKYHSTDIAAAIALTNLETIDEANSIRAKIAARYFAAFPDAAPMYCANRMSSFHFAPLFFENRDEVYEALRAASIYPTMHYKPNYRYGLYKSYPRVGGCVGAEEYSRTALVLPFHLDLSASDINRVIEVVQACSPA
jgi:perosamine synthetase